MRLFFSAPFTKEFDFRAGKYKDPSYPLFLQEVTALLERLSHEVYLAQREDGWGESVNSPENDAEKDFDYIRRWCDCVICYPRDYTSTGVCIELGWASSLGKRIFLLEESSQATPPYVQGLRMLTEFTIVRFGDTPTLLDLLAEKLR
jgi:hypothetical protein